jgi:Ariadne domain
MQPGVSVILIQIVLAYIIYVCHGIPHAVTTFDRQPFAVQPTCAGNYISCRDLKRYHHYLGRWEAHVASQKLEEEQTKTIQVQLPIA